MSALLLQAEGLRPCFDDEPSSGTGSDFTLAAGARYAVLGSQAEKVSAWLRCLAGLEDPCRGRVRALGDDLSRLDKRAWQQMRTRIAYLSADSRLLSVLSMQDNILQPALYHKRGSREDLLAACYRLLDEIGPVDDEKLAMLPAYLDDDSYARALIVRALLLQPSIIILDDFFRTRTLKQANALLDYVFIRLEQQGMAALVYDHHMDLLQAQCEPALFVADQGLLEFDSWSALMASNSADVKAFLLDHDVDAYGG